MVGDEPDVVRLVSQHLLQRLHEWIVRRLERSDQHDHVLTEERRCAGVAQIVRGFLNRGINRDAVGARSALANSGHRRGDRAVHKSLLTTTGEGDAGRRAHDGLSMSCRFDLSLAVGIATNLAGSPNRGGRSHHESLRYPRGGRCARSWHRRPATPRASQRSDVRRNCPHQH